jgi:hypothetical protein
VTISDAALLSREITVLEPGLKAMTEHILKAYRIDIEARTNPEGNQRAIADGWKVNAHEIKVV